MGLLSFATPYILWIKLALIAAALVGAGWVGHEWTRRGYEAAKVADMAVATRKYNESVEEYKAKIHEHELLETKIVDKYAVIIKAMTTDQQKLRKDIKNATSNQPACTFTLGFTGVWDRSIDRANGKGVPAGGEDTASTSGADRGIAEIGREDLLVNHDAIMQQCGKWKAQLDSIIEWDSKRSSK